VRYIFFFILFYLASFSSFAQPANNNCSSAQSLCPNTPLSGNTAGATDECGGADGDCTGGGGWAPCYSVSGSMWYSFTTDNNGGGININLSNISCSGSGGSLQATLVQATTPCNSSTYTTIDCFNGSSSNFSLSGNNLLPNTTYYVMINSSQTAGTNDCTFDINASGSAMEQEIEAEINSVICNQSFGSATINVLQGGQGPYTYSLDGGQTQSSNSFDNLSYGNHSVTVTDANGCQMEYNFFVNDSLNNLTVDAGEDVTIIQGSSTQLNANGNGTAYGWEPSTGLDNATNQTVNASPTATTTYTAYTYSPEGCQVSDQVVVTVLLPVIIPNTFTPNGDGFNDTWQILRIAQYPDNKVYIFDRWGQRIYQKNGYSPEGDWDGNYLGTPLPTATYYYVIELNANTDSPDFELLKGSVTIIR
jgi:gliding motility-associated-like protein